MFDSTIFYLIFLLAYSLFNFGMGEKKRESNCDGKKSLGSSIKNGEMERKKFVEVCDAKKSLEALEAKVWDGE
jgi:hypothetical protein